MSRFVWTAADIVVTAPRREKSGVRAPKKTPPVQARLAEPRRRRPKPEKTS